jgi:hypothetical protein
VQRLARLFRQHHPKETEATLRELHALVRTALACRPLPPAARKLLPRPRPSLADP